MHQTMWVTPGKGKNSSNILSSILSFSTNNEEMTCYTTSNMKCLEYKSSLLSRIKQLDYFVHLGFRIISVKPSPQQWYQLTLKHALAQAGWESGHSSFTNSYFQVCPSARAKLSKDCLAFSALIQLRFANIQEEHTKADWSFSKWHNIQMNTIVPH